MPRELDYSYAPLTYWPGEWVTELTTIRGSFARWMAAGMAPEDRPKFGGHPFSLTAGEWLPELHAGEVEIARVELRSATGDVISVRAHLGDDDLIHYRIVDEYAFWEFHVRPESSVTPLSMAELISLIDTVEWHPGDDQVEIGLTDCFRNAELEGCGLDDAMNFVSAGSSYYPGLSGHYDQDAERWLNEKLVQSWDDGNDCLCGQEPDAESNELEGHREDCRTLVALRWRNLQAHSNDD